MNRKNMTNYKFSLKKFKLGLGTAIIGLTFGTGMMVSAATPTDTTSLADPETTITADTNAVTEEVIEGMTATEAMDAEIAERTNQEVVPTEQAQTGDVIDVTIDESDVTETEYEDGSLSQEGSVVVTTTSIADPKEVTNFSTSQEETWESQTEYEDGNSWYTQYETVVKTTIIEYLLASETEEWSYLGDVWLKFITEQYDYDIEASPIVYGTMTYTPQATTTAPSGPETAVVVDELPHAGDTSDTSFSMMGLMTSITAMVLATRKRKENN